MDNLQGAKGAYFCTDPADCAVLFNGKVRIDQFESAFRADRYAASAISANIPMYFEHSEIMLASCFINIYGRQFPEIRSVNVKTGDGRTKTSF
jgi:hypothetical protein